MTKRLISNSKQWARTIKRDVHAVWLAARDPRTPWFAKVLAVVIAAYAVSPIDLVPDFIPVLGYVDDIIIVPLGILLVVKLIPPEIMNEHRETADEASERPTSRIAAGVFIAIWIAFATFLARMLL
ncbi:YkvA family protein [Salinicola salarius]|uniref:YkvA family protein n=1 Tax=Salinicola salarius TaxID=430457 RepID=UPI000DA11EF8